MQDIGKAERVNDDLVFIIYLPFTKVGKSVEGMMGSKHQKVSLGYIVTCLLNIPED